MKGTINTHDAENRVEGSALAEIFISLHLSSRNITEEKIERREKAKGREMVCKMSFFQQVIDMTITNSQQL